MGSDPRPCGALIHRQSPWRPPGTGRPLAAGVACLVGLVWMLFAAAAWSDESRQRTDLRVEMRGLRFDNLFQRPAAGSDARVGAAGLSVQLEWPMVRSGWLRSRVQVDTLLFDGMGPSNVVELGLDAGGDHARLRLGGGRSWGRPSFSAGDELELADGRHLGGELALRPLRWLELRGEAFSRRETFPSGGDRDVRTDAYGGALRYRGLGAALSPEVGWLRADREAARATQAAVYDERWALVRSSPAPWAYISVRFRQRLMDYTVSDPGASNFGRHDVRDQWTVGVALRTGEVLTWNLYYSTTTGRSSRPGRDFDSSTMGFGLTLGVSESRGDLERWKLWSAIF